MPLAPETYQARTDGTGRAVDRVHPDMCVRCLVRMLDEGRIPAGGWPGGWESWPVTVRAHRLRLQAFAGRLPAYPGGFDGRGVVTCAGGSKYFTAAWVMLSVLRRHGCHLPVEVWHLGPQEIDPRMRGLLEGLGGVRVVDAAAVSAGLPPDRRPRKLGGWESKAFAVQHSAFREVLFLDADQVPARDPSDLFDAPEYQDRGAAFWPDHPPHGWCLTRTAFEAAGLAVPGNSKNSKWHNPTDYTPFESGQILIDKGPHWGPLAMWRHLGDHADFWYRWEAERKGANHCYGDKDTAYLAWRILKASVAMPPACDWTGSAKTSGAFLQKDFAGRVVFQHRVQPTGKWSLHGENHRTPGLLFWEWCVEALDGLRARWVGHPWDRGDETAAERAAADGVADRWVLFQGDRPQLEIALAPDGRVEGTADRSDRWTVREWAGERRLVLSNWNRAWAVLGPDPYGNWVNHGADAFLVPAAPAGFALVPGRFEAGMAVSILGRNEYRLPGRLPAGSVVLDVGAHCGVFVRACLDRGAAHVVAVEPTPSNLAYLRKNYGADGRVTILPVAAWDKHTTLRLGIPEGAGHSAGWSAVSAGGSVEVRAVPARELIRAATAKSRTGRVALLKLDCEGAEWEVLASADLSAVDAVVGEYHLARRPPEYTPELLADLLSRQGFEVETVPHVEGLGHVFAHRPASAVPFAVTTPRS